MWPPTEDDIDMKRVRIIPCRGRLARESTNVACRFTSRQLDAAARLTELDKEILSRNQNPPERVKTKIQLRIVTAQQLKYGGRT